MLIIDDRVHRPDPKPQGPAGNGTGGRVNRREDFGEELVSLSVASRPERLRLIRQVVSLAASDSGCSEEESCDLVLAVDEACQNVIRHAYRCDANGKIIVTVYRRDDHLIVLIRDFAAPVDVETVRPRNLSDLRPGGLGTHLMRAVLDDIEFLPPPAGGGNLLKLVKKIRQGQP
jgi:sigma-B regulation protein RsbU (phosphoserine phosphatase)